MSIPFRPLVATALLLLAAAAAVADPPDLENGEEIMEVCAGCHGEYAEGGKQGEYPRLAGLPAGFIARQLHLFRDHKRPNMPMLQYVDERQMPDEDIVDISAYISNIKLKTKLPPLPKGKKFDALGRLEQAKQVFNVPRAPGDVKAGEKMYNRECRSCHGTDGWGRPKKNVPQLAGQYTNYLWRQVKKYRQGIRIHDPSDPEDRLLKDFTDKELQNIFAFFSTVDDR